MLVPLAFDALVNFFAVHGDGLRGSDADSYLSPFESEHRDRDVVADHERFADAARQDEHMSGSPCQPHRLSVLQLTSACIKTKTFPVFRCLSTRYHGTGRVGATRARPLIQYPQRSGTAWTPAESVFYASLNARAVAHPKARRCLWSLPRPHHVQVRCRT